MTTERPTKRCSHCGGDALHADVLCAFCGRPLHDARAVPAGARAHDEAGVPPVYAADTGAPNTSGMQSWVPPGVAQGFNWGGFLVTGSAWAFSMRMPGWAMLTIVTGLPMHVVLGIRGNEWAWQHRAFESVAEFERVQRAWTRWGIALTAATPAILAAMIAVAWALWAGV